jgi:hypothetical protein
MILSVVSTLNPMRVRAALNALCCAMV